MRSWVLFWVLAALFLAPPAWGGKAKEQVVMALTEVSTSGGAVTATINRADHQTGYLIVKTENEVATASLAVVVAAVTDSGEITICTATAITTDTTTAILLGSTVAAGEGVTDVCDFPVTRQTKVTFTVTGAGADFDVTADMEWVYE